MNRLRLMVALLMGIAMLDCVSVPAQAAPTPPDVVATLLPTPAGDTNASTLSIACGGPGFCVAVGQVVVGSTLQGLIDTWSGGHWSTQVAPVPANVGAGSGSSLLKVACGGVGLCAAYGTYTATDNTQHTSVLALRSGMWHATDLGVPAPAGGFGYSVAGVACAGTGCVVSGNFYDQTGDTLRHSFAAIDHGGVWTTHTITPPADHIDFGTAQPTSAVTIVDDVSCTLSLCFAVGTYPVADGTGRGLGVAIDPGAQTVNATQLSLGAVAAFGSVDRVWCAASGGCLGVGSYADAGNAMHRVVLPVGGGSSPLAPVVTPTPVQANSVPTVIGAACAAAPGGTSCVLSGNYTDTSSPATYPNYVDHLSSGAWSSVGGTFPHTLTSWACGSAAFCVGTAGGSYYGPQQAITAYSAGAWTTQDAPDPASTAFPRPRAGAMVAVSCDAPTSCWVLGSATTNEGLAEHVTPRVPPVPPTASLLSPTSPFTLATSAKVQWATTGATSVHVRRQTASARAGFGPWVTIGTVPASTLSTTLGGLARGSDYCFSVRAEGAGGTTGWTGSRCVSVPLDDRAVTTDVHWKRITSTAYWNGTATAATALGARLTFSAAQLDRLAIVATRCPTCGKIAVYVGSSMVATINLASVHAANRVVFVVPHFSFRTGTVSIKVLTSGRPVIIDGLGISRT